MEDKCLMQVPLQDPGRQYRALKDEIDQGVLRVLESGRWLFGEQTGGFEASFSAYCGVKYTLAVANGTDAIELALAAAEARGREVITVANAGGYATAACRITGAMPVYVDVDSDSLLMSLSEALAAVTPRTAAVVITHLYGRLADVAAFRSGLISIGRQDVMIIEDCAQAHGAVRDGHYAGSLGDLGTFSFYPTKNLGGMGDGGAVVCSDDALSERVSLLRQYGWRERYVSVIPYGRNSRMDEIQAAILRIKVGRIDEWNARRREIVRRYREAASAPCSIWFDGSQAFAAHLAVARHPERERVRKQLGELGVMTAVHYPVLDCDQQGQQGLPFVVCDLSSTRRAAGEIFTLPCFPEMTDREIDLVCEGIRRTA